MQNEIFEYLCGSVKLECQIKALRRVLKARANDGGTDKGNAIIERYIERLRGKINK